LLKKKKETSISSCVYDVFGSLELLVTLL